MLYIVFFLIIHLVVGWKTTSLLTNLSTCQAFAIDNQSECSETEVQIIKISDQYLICLIEQDVGIHSTLYQSNSTITFIAFVNQYFYIIPLPYACSQTYQKLQSQIQLTNYSITIANSSVYIYGGINSSGYSNKLYQINIDTLFSGTVIAKEMGNNYLSNLTVTLALWDSNNEDYSFTSNFPQICQLKNKNYSFSISTLLDQECNSGNTPGCLADSILVYDENCDCLQLFFGVYQNSSILATPWTYSISLEVWQIMEIEQNISIQTNPIGTYFSDLQIVGFYIPTKYFFFNETKFYDNYGTITFNENPFQMIGYQNITYILNGSTIIYSNTDQSNIISQQFGIYKCEKNFNGNECSSVNTLCPGSVCFFDTLYGQICIYCSGHGTCSNGTCKCNDGYTDKDCGSYKTCVNNCSTVGECVQYFPLSQCDCPQTQKRGGEDCGTIFCLNDCSSNGVCNTGECKCNSGFKGDDCSLLDLSFISE